MKTNYGKTEIKICNDYEDLGKKSASEVATILKELLVQKKEVRAVFAAGESQATFLNHLSKQSGIDWKRVVCLLPNSPHLLLA